MLGWNHAGQLGLGDRTNRQSPVPVSGLSGVAEAAPGGSHTCARTQAGAVWCWGSNLWGQLGLGNTTWHDRPAPVPGLSGVVEVATGGSHTCARTQAGAVWCWGRNLHGELGLGDTTNRLSPTPVPGLSGVAQVAAGETHTCARTQAGEVWCWGGNGNGQLGLGNTAQRLSPAPVPGLSGVVEVAAGEWHTCARTQAGAVWCWGANWAGNLGLGDTTNRLSPAPVPGLSGVEEVAPGGDHTCARMQAGAVWCWGANDSGQLGLGDTDRRLSPTPVPGLSGVAQMAAGGGDGGTGHTCARTQAGAVWCWGENGIGQLGLGDTDRRLSPAPLPDFTPWIEFIGGGTVFEFMAACASGGWPNTPHPARLRYGPGEVNGMPSQVGILFPSGSEHLQTWHALAQSTLNYDALGRQMWTFFVLQQPFPRTTPVQRRITVPANGTDIATATEVMMRLRVSGFGGIPGCGATVAGVLRRAG